MNSVDFRVIYFIVVIINIVENKRYDIRQQCQDEYGLDLEGVLRQFRRSDDYLQILKWTTQEFHNFYMDIIVESLDYNIDQMRTKIKADMGIIDPSTLSSPSAAATLTTTTPAAPIQDKTGLRMGGDGRRYDRPPGIMGQDSVKNKNKVRRLDGYSKLNSYLTVEERNHYKALGFTYVGDVIHTVISGFGGHPVTDDPHRSTLMYQQSSKYPTTVHMLKHVATKVFLAGSGVTSPSDGAATAGNQLRQKSLTRFALVGRPLFER